MKRPKFELDNGYPEPEGNDTMRMVTIILATVAIVVIGYFAYNYWYECTDWGFLKFCSMVQRP